MRCRESPLLPSEVDAAVSGETSLDHESAARVVVTVRMTGTSTETYLSATMPALIAGDVDPLTLTPAVYAESRRVSA